MMSALKFDLNIADGCSAAVLLWPRTTTAGASRPVMSRCWRRHMSDATRGDGAGRHGVTWVVSRGARTNFSVSVAVIPWGAVTWPGMARHRNNIAAAFSEITLICRHVSNVCHWQCCKIFGEDAYHRFQPLKICKSVINGCLTWQKPPVTPPRQDPQTRSCSACAGPGRPQSASTGRGPAPVCKLPRWDRDQWRGCGESSVVQSYSWTWHQWSSWHSSAD